MSDADLDDVRPVRQRKSKATKTDDDQGEALAEDLVDDEWDDAALERSTVQRVKLEDGTTATEIGTKERDEVDEEADSEDSGAEEEGQPVKAKCKRRKRPAKTDRTANAFTGQEIYFAEAQRQPFLTPKRERDLGTRARQGDKQARDELVQAHIRLVTSMARDFRSKHQWAQLDLEDLISEGTVAATQAAKRFDAAQARFATYAAVWIRRAFQSHLDKTLDAGGEPKYRVDGDVEEISNGDATMLLDFDTDIPGPDHEASPGNGGARSTDEWQRGFEFGRNRRQLCPEDASDDFRAGFAEGRQSRNPESDATFEMLEAAWRQRRSLSPEHRKLLDDAIEYRRQHGMQLPGVHYLKCQAPGCGRFFEAERADAKFCPGGKCRKRASRKVKCDAIAA
jgi:RNA polymerase sigma factor (sigma-70 family)